ncbi:xanthine dehydrogenase family protein molybdopterin-binding subunit [Streptomyces sp. H27-D2]|uniref:xanthine dehydrogenase family protein molybdopterin-binding subunit n=1 Tax=Streptomyces sp. H27-D2 TaxID=3046304 RepID=UPI002DB69C15|nr:xanthine dehydrogenase family protein molybdopterin-binding subunit [Streptomyces sp. H27-D2]MEC4016911.1 xanthine dehydrogenase family protein molybdopterin-binding subunit [Streptomyces sp. H27-D2]
MNDTSVPASPLPGSAPASLPTSTPASPLVSAPASGWPHASRPASAAIPAGLRRPDGPAKLTGAARYSGDTPADGAAYAVLVGATVARGRVAELDTAAARGAPGVTAVLTAADLPDLGAAPLAHSVVPMQRALDGAVRYEGQPIAIVLAKSWEQARYAAGLVRAGYADVRPAVTFEEAEDEQERGPVMSPADERKGDVAAGLAAAHTTVSAAYSTADRHHSPIEPSATHARWDGERLTVHDSVQSVSLTRQALAAAFGVPAEQVRVISPYVGGGFGCKGYIWPHQILAAAAALVTGRPVKLQLTRAQMFTACGHQPVTRQTVSLGADAEGRLTALRHTSANATSRDDDHAEYTTDASTWMYASPAIEVRRRVRHTDRPQPTPMRAPHVGLGMFALESAMDELAYAAGIDPVELRLRNEPETDPLTGRPFSSRKQRECLREGAERFGWAARTSEPRSMRAGDELIGWGMAAATMDTFRFPSTARVGIDAEGRVRVETGTQEIGTGLPGVIAGIAAEVLGADPRAVEVRIGDTLLPPAAMTAGSSATIGVGSAVHAAASALREKLDGPVAPATGPGAREPGADGYLEAEATWAPEESADPGGRSTTYSMHTYGAVFVEVRVDEELGLVRMERCTGVYAAGRIVNPLTARSQMTGGIAWGLGQALLEESRFDARLGRFRSKNLAGYVVPVNADIRDLDVSFVDDHDPHASALGAKGIGELGAVGVSAAIVNAVFHATGVRVRNLPVGIADLLG